jgi:hypothetical protein
MSLTATLTSANDILRALRADANELAVSLLDDDNGISTESYELLTVLFARLGGMPELNVDATDGRWYIPNRSF